MRLIINYYQDTWDLRQRVPMFNPSIKLKVYQLQEKLKGNKTNAASEQKKGKNSLLDEVMVTNLQVTATFVKGITWPDVNDVYSVNSLFHAG